MKKIFLAAIISSIFACNSSNEGGAGDREHNMGTKDENVNNTPAEETSIGDSTPTTNNNIYNTDSASGQGTVYDTAAGKSGGR